MDLFDQRKKSVLSKADKAAKGSWDLRVKELCEKINSFEDYYTTSSCSGKSVIMEEKVGKDGSYYLWSSHELLSFDELKKILINASVPPTHPIISGRVKKKGKDIIKFKLQSPVFFVVCRDIGVAKDLLEKAVDSGFKESGIKMTNKLIGVEIRSGEKIEFPLIKGGEILVWDEFLRVLVEEVNRKREIGWKKIENLVGVF